MEKYRWSIIHCRSRLNWGKTRKRGRKHLHRKYVSLLRSIRVRYAPVSNVCVCVCVCNSRKTLSLNGFMHYVVGMHEWMNEWKEWLTSRDLRRSHHRTAAAHTIHCSRICDGGYATTTIERDTHVQWVPDIRSFRLLGQFLDHPKNNFVSEIARTEWMLHRKRKETKQQPGTAGQGNILGFCLVSFHFLWAIHPIRPVTVGYSDSFGNPRFITNKTPLLTVTKNRLQWHYIG